MFAAAAARVDQEISIGRLVAALRSLLEKPGLSEALNDLKQRWGQLYDRATSLPGQLTAGLRKELAARRKQGNAAVMIRVAYVEIELDEKKRERKIITRQPVRWGSLSGLQALDSKPLGRVGQRLSDARSTLDQAVASEDRTADELGKWVDGLEYIERAEQDLKQYEANYTAFCGPENLKLLWLLFQDRYDQLAAIRVALEITSRMRITDAETAAVRNTWVDEIKAAHGGREFDFTG
jgi:hypothetical protein